MRSNIALAQIISSGRAEHEAVIAAGPLARRQFEEHRTKLQAGSADREPTSTQSCVQFEVWRCAPALEICPVGMPASFGGGKSIAIVEVVLR